MFLLVKLLCFAVIAIAMNSISASDTYESDVQYYSSQLDSASEDLNDYVPRTVRQVKIPLQRDSSGVNIRQYNVTRHTRDVSFPGIKKPTHHDVIIPNWNPNARIKPWQVIGVKNRKTRSAIMP
ncbi:unnamed protein product [Danaus chrysippus]|uniref:(African queen) hypothetical protein n=1 Tax=Danaus chrysippus TaxID=151541 RepID=A0A8J2WBB6_9NEOP|nr:unnamed protein product [Danaus chrysippus]